MLYIPVYQTQKKITAHLYGVWINNYNVTIATISYETLETPEIKENTLFKVLR